MHSVIRVAELETGFGRDTPRQLWGGPLPEGLTKEAYENSPLPEDAKWYSARVALDELQDLYHRCGVYSALSGDTLRVEDSALMVTQGRDEGHSQAMAQAGHIREIVGSFEQRKLSPLHLGTNDLAAGPYNVLDGNCRAVALLLLHQRNALALEYIPVFVATSETKMRSHVGREPNEVLVALRLL